MRTIDHFRVRLIVIEMNGFSHVKIVMKITK